MRLKLAPALAVALTALVALPHDAGGYRLAKWAAFGFALAAAAAALLLRRAPPRLPSGPLGIVACAFVLAAVALPALSPALSPTHAPSAAGLLAGLAFLAVTAATLDGDAAARRASLQVLAGAGAICAAIVLLQAAGLRWLTSDTYTGAEFRAPGTTGNPNWAAAFLAPLVPVALALAATGGRRRIHLAAAALLSAATAATLSRGGVLTLAAGLLVHVLLDRGVPARRRAALLALAVACAATALLVVGILGLHDSLPWMRGRVFLWRCALWMIGEHPLTGVGLGGYVPAYGRAAAAVIGGDASAFMPLSSVDFAHDDPLQLAAEGGVITAALFGLVIAAALARAHRLQDPLSRAAGAGVAALFVNGLADSPLGVPATFALLFFLLGSLAPTSRAPPAGGRLVIAAVVLLGLLQGVRFAAGNHHWTLGRDALRAGRPAVQHLERARFFLPEHGRSASQHAQALAREGRIEDAIRASEVAATLRFDLDDEIFRRDLRARSLDRAAAIATWRELSDRFPALITPHLRLGALHVQQNDRAAAIAEYEAALAIRQPTARAEEARRQAAAMLRLLRAGRAE